MYIIRFTREYIFAIINDRISPLVKKKTVIFICQPYFPGHIAIGFAFSFDHISLNFLFANILINTEFSHLYVLLMCKLISDPKIKALRSNNMCTLSTGRCEKMAPKLDFIIIISVNSLFQ